MLWAMRCSQWERAMFAQFRVMKHDHRHCEPSEPIQQMPAIAGLLCRSAPRNDGAPCSKMQPIRPARRFAVQRILLTLAATRRDALERVPQDAIVATLLVGRKVALQHAAI